MIDLRRMTVVLLVCLVAGILAAEDVVKRLKDLQTVYDKLDSNVIRIPILDAIKLTNANNPIVSYLDFVEGKYVWVILTSTTRFEISAVDGKLLRKSQIKQVSPKYTVDLKNAISLAILSIGKSILFAFPTDEGWIVGSKDNVANVSLKTAAIIWIKSRKEYFESLKSQGG